MTEKVKIHGKGLKKSSKILALVKWAARGRAHRNRKKVKKGHRKFRWLTISLRKGGISVHRLAALWLGTSWCTAVYRAYSRDFGSCHKNTQSRF